MFRDKVYLSTLARIATPIIIQQFITMFLNMVDVIMIGQLGEVPLAAVGLANQVSFLLNLLMFGISSGAAVFAAQFWGKKDISGIHKVLGISLGASLLGAAFFGILANNFPEKILSFYSKDPAVITTGSEYLKIVWISYFASAITFSFASILRSTENVKLPMFASMIALSMNTVLNYLLIFGNFGFPELGVKGAAIATTISRTVELGIMLMLTYKRKTPAAAKIKEMFNIQWPFIKMYFQTALPVIVQEIVWSLGITTYNMVYARIGTESIAAVNIATTIDGVAFVLFIGIGNACAIMVGNKIGAEKDQEAHLYAGRTLKIAAMSAVLVGSLILVGADWFLTFFNISDAAIAYARNILTFIGLALWIRASNMTIIIGILRSGGDTKFAFYLELLSIWLAGVPLALIGAFVLNLEVHIVYLFTIAEEIIKFIIGLIRFLSRKWIHHVANLSETVISSKPL
ncbi:MAG: MATE family efflux transporter [Anaerolineaceae bacterium]|nr:MATE family efflux transporter [Anaerolineaceae bacterium]